MADPLQPATPSFKNYAYVQSKIYKTVCMYIAGHCTYCTKPWHLQNLQLEARYWERPFNLKAARISCPLLQSLHKNTRKAGVSIRPFCTQISCSSSVTLIQSMTSGGYYFCESVKWGRFWLFSIERPPIGASQHVKTCVSYDIDDTGTPQPRDESVTQINIMLSLNHVI